MVFFGSNSSTVKEGELVNVTCPNCNETTKYNYIVFQKYAHIYWIPAFPTSKKKICECTSCYKTYEAKHLPESIKSKLDFELQGLKPHIKFFSASILFAMLVLGIMYMTKQDNEENAAFIETPVKGDIYSFETDEGYGHYTTLKIAEVTQDTLYVFLNEYETNKKTGISDVDKLKNYTVDTYSISREEINTMFADGKIFDVERK